MSTPDELSDQDVARLLERKSIGALVLVGIEDAMYARGSDGVWHRLSDEPLHALPSTD